MNTCMDGNERIYSIIKTMIEQKMLTTVRDGEPRETDMLYTIMAFAMSNGEKETMELLENMQKALPYKGVITSQGHLDKFVYRSPARHRPKESYKDTIIREIEGAYITRRLSFLIRHSYSMDKKYPASTVKNRYDIIMKYFLPFFNDKIRGELSSDTLADKWLEKSKIRYQHALLAVFNHFLNGEPMKTNEDGNHVLGSFEEEVALAQSIMEKKRRTHKSADAKPLIYNGTGTENILALEQIGAERDDLTTGNLGFIN